MITPPPPGQPLAGRTIVTTRPEAGAVDAALTALGARVFHLPLIEITDADAAERDELTRLLAMLGDPNVESSSTTAPTNPRQTHPDLPVAYLPVAYLAVTSAAGARRVGALAARSPVRLAAVGTATAAVLAELAGRPVDIVPERQTAHDLVAAFPEARPGDRVVVAQASRAAPTLVDGLRARGYHVHPVTAYHTELRVPSATDIATALAADAVVFASGSAAEAWSDAIGTATPRHVIAIGPTTTDVANSRGLRVTNVALDHSVDGLVAATIAALS